MRYVPVIIVGGGPVGMALAMNLATFKVPALLVNTEPNSRWHPKGSTHNARTMEHYRRLGVARGLRKLGLPQEHPTDVGYFTTLNGWELARIPMPSEHEKIAGVAGASGLDQVPEPLFRCNQMYVEAHLFQHIQTLPTIEPKFGWCCTNISNGKERTRVTIEQKKTGEREDIECGYLVGCDGSHSTVRQHLGFSYGGEIPEEQSYGSGATVSSHIRAPNLYKKVLRDPCWQYWTVNPRVRSNLVTLDGEGEFLFNTKLRSGGDKPDQDLISRMFNESVGEKMEIEFLGHWPWTAGHALVSERFGEGRISLAGDAVHLFTPAGGFGMNTGIDDAANLGWKIAAMIEGWGGQQLISTYETERRPIAFRNTGMAKHLARNIGKVPITDALLESSVFGDQTRKKLGEHLLTFGEEFASIGVQLGARYDGSPIVVSDDSIPPQDDPLVYQPTACPGGRAPHLFLSGNQSLFDHLGIGFTLLTFQAGENTKLMEDAAAIRRVPLKILNLEHPDGRELYGSNLALIRPDQHVAWRGDTLPEDCGELLALVTGW